MDSTREKPKGSHPRNKKKRDKRESLKDYSYPTANFGQYESTSEFSASDFDPYRQPKQRLFPTMSDSAVCNNTLPYNFSINSGVPVYQTILPTTMLPINRHVQMTSPHTRGNHHFMMDNDMLISNQSAFMSLPPRNVDDINSEEKRRFSDPGLNNVDESNESNTSDTDSDNSSIGNNSSLYEQITKLKSENQRLSNELEMCTNEIKKLKTELVVISSKQSNSESISFTQMVKEIRDAAENREKALISRMEAMVMKSIQSVEAKNNNEFKNEIALLGKRLDNLEDYVRHDENCKLKNEINGDISKYGLKMQKQNHVVNKMSNARIFCNTTDESSESSFSSIGSSSISSTTLTSYGPVTNL